MRPPVAVDQRAEALASPFEFTYLLEFWADKMAEDVAVTVKTPGRTVDAAVERVDDYMWMARAECLDTFRDDEIITTVTTDGMRTDFAPWKTRVIFHQPWRIDAGVDGPLEQHIGNFLAAMKTAPAADIRVMYRYGQPPVEVPVVIIPGYDGDTSIAAMIADAVKTWLATIDPPREHAQLVMNFTTPTLTITNATIDLAR